MSVTAGDQLRGRIHAALDALGDARTLFDELPEPVRRERTGVAERLSLAEANAHLALELIGAAPDPKEDA